MAQITNNVLIGKDTRDRRDAVATKVVRPQPIQAMSAVRTLRRSLPLELPDRVRGEAGRLLDAIESELRAPDPDRGLVAVRLRRFTELLIDAGALTPGASVIRPMRAIATWLGPIGAALTPRSA